MKLFHNQQELCDARILNRDWRDFSFWDGNSAAERVLQVEVSKIVRVGMDSMTGYELVDENGRTPVVITKGSQHPRDFMIEVQIDRPTDISP